MLLLSLWVLIYLVVFPRLLLYLLLLSVGVELSAASRGVGSMHSGLVLVGVSGGPNEPALPVPPPTTGNANSLGPLGDSHPQSRGTGMALEPSLVVLPPVAATGNTEALRVPLVVHQRLLVQKIYCLGRPGLPY